MPPTPAPQPAPPFTIHHSPLTVHHSSTFSLPTACTIVDVRRDNYRTKTFTLDRALDARPGQFIMLWLPRFDEKPFSLVSADPITLMITAVGPTTRLLHERGVGDRLWIRGPFGRGYDVPANERRLALVAGGYGVAPLLWLAERARPVIDALHVVIGARGADDLLYRDRFRQLAEQPGAPIHLHATTEDGSAGQRGRVTDALAPLLDAGEIDGLYACGPDPMLAALRDLARTHNLPSQLSWEAYMRCAMGLCGSCEHEGHLLCLDGPVLREEAGG